MIANKESIDLAPSRYGSGHPLEYISASRVNCWQQCQRKFFFRYVQKVPSKPSPALHLGKAVHAALEKWNKTRWLGDPFNEEEVRKAYMQAWLCPEEHTQWESSSTEKKTFDQGWSMIEMYLKETPIPFDESILGVEVRVEAVLPDLPPIIGIIDLVRKVDGQGKIVDFKTAAKSPSAGVCAFIHGTQLGIYSLLYRENTGEKEGGLELHHLIKTKVPKVVVSEIDPISDTQIEQLKSLLHSYVRSVQAEDFPASPSFMCSGCEYLEQCKSFAHSPSQKGGAKCGI